MREKLREGRPTFPSGNVAGFRSRKVAAMRPRSTAEPHVVRRRRWALHTNWTARPLFCAATNALLSANGRKVSAFTGSDLPERRFRGVTLFNSDWCAWQSGKCPPFNIELPAFTPRRDKEDEV